MDKFLLNRKLRVEIKSSAASDAGMLVFSDAFRVTFDITRVADGTRPDTCELSVYNLQHNNYSLFKYDPINPLTLTIYAGYDKQFGIVFRGDITATDFERAGNDNIMKITVGDGVVASKKKINKTYNNAQASAMAQDIIKEMKSAGIEVAKGAIEEIKAKLTGKTITGKTTLKETAKKALNKILKGTDIDYNVVNNELKIVDSVKKKINDFGVEINGLNGLIGAPAKKREQREDGSTVDLVSFKCLINPDIVPGREVNIDSKYITGKYVVQNMRVSGDTWASGEWTIEAEAL
jgi:hypothetical protein